MTMTVFRTMDMSMQFVILSTFSISFSYPENDVMHPVLEQGGGRQGDVADRRARVSEALPDPQGGCIDENDVNPRG